MQLQLQITNNIFFLKKIHLINEPKLNCYLELDTRKSSLNFYVNI